MAVPRGDWRSLRPHPRTVTRYRKSGWWRQETYVDDLVAAAREAPEGVVLINWRSDSSTEVHLTFGQLHRYARRFAGGLRALGIGQGDVVAFHLPGWWEASALTFACGLIGAIAAPSPMWFGPAALAYLWPDIQPAICIVPEKWNGIRHAEALAEIADNVPSLRHRVVVGDAQATAALDFADHFIRTHWEQDDSCAFPGLDPDQVAMVLFTSGTTGRAQAVLHTANTLNAGVQGSLRAWPLEPGKRVVAVPSPMTHISGILHAILGPVIGRYVAVVPDDIHTDQLHDLCLRHDVTLLLASPPRLHALVTAAEASPRRASRLRTIINIGATIPHALATSLKTSFDADLLNEWGSTQTCGGTMTSSDDPPEWATRSIGRPIPGAEVRVVPTEDTASDLARLHIRGPATCIGVFDRAGTGPATPADAEGWHETGDLVSQDGRGGLRYRGRGELLVGAPYIPLIELEDHLRAHPAIHDIALVDLPQPAPGSTLCAAVVAAPGTSSLTLDDLCTEFVKLGLAEDVHPKRLERLQELPRDDLGKLLRRRLREVLSSSRQT
jgi:cyclohexanecarboxylate-CoA ligase